MRQLKLAGRMLAGLRGPESYRKLAARAKCTPNYIFYLEKAKIPDPSPEYLTRLAQALKTDPDEFCSYFGKLPTDLDRYVQMNTREVAWLLRHKFLSARADEDAKTRAVGQD
jgi:transcriptional regulator with XRE-family HTH domain